MHGGRVIQGFFIGGGPRPSAATTRAPIQRAVPGTARAPGPPAPAFAPAQTAQRHGGNGSFEIDPVQVGLASGGGSPLPKSVLAKMEAAFGTDFSGVRVHVGPQASRIGAVAFTMGDNVYFAPGQFQPDTVKGQQLLGHELAHVVQQRQGRVRAPGSGVAVVQDRMLEAEADRLGMQAAAHRAAPVQAKMAGGRAQVHVPTPTATGGGSYRVAAGAMGSLMVHTRGASAEVTDLSVGSHFRDQGIGRELLRSAAQTGLRAGNSKVSLSAQDNGSGRLTRWYKDMGFRQIGVNSRGFPLLEAPIGQLLAGTVQRKLASARDDAQPRRLSRPLIPGYVRDGIIQRSFQVGSISFNNPQNFKFTVTSAEQAVTPLDRGEVGKTTGLSSKSGVKVGDIGSYVVVQHIEKVGDGLTGDHQPSGAAIKEAIRELLHTALNRALTRGMAKVAYGKAITIVMEDAWHKANSRTYGGRNTKKQIAEDAADFMVAAIKDWEKTVPELQKTMQDKEIEDLWKAFNETREEFFKTGDIQFKIK